MSKKSIISAVGVAVIYGVFIHIFPSQASVNDARWDESLRSMQAGDLKGASCFVDNFFFPEEPIDTLSKR